MEFDCLHTCCVSCHIAKLVKVVSIAGDTSAVWFINFFMLVINNKPGVCDGFIWWYFVCMNSTQNIKAVSLFTIWFEALE